MAEPLARLRAVLEAATPGPWETGQTGRTVELRGAGENDVCAFDDQGPFILARVNAPCATDEDARAIAALGTLWPALLAHVTAAREVRRQLRDHTCVPGGPCWECALGEVLDDADEDLIAAIDAALPEVTDAGE